MLLAMVIAWLLVLEYLHTFASCTIAFCKPLQKAVSEILLNQMSVRRLRLILR